MYVRKSTVYYYLGALLAVIATLFFALYFMFIVVGIGDVGIGKVIQNPVVLLSILAIIIIAPIASVIYFKRKQQHETLEYIICSVIRYVVAFLMFFYGYTKMYHKFFEITYLTQDSRVTDVSSFSLAWYFYGKSNVQEFLIGLLEFIPAVLLLFRRTKFVGTILVFPVAANVLMVNIFNRVSGITFPVSVFITLADVYLIYGYKDRISAFLKSVVDIKKILNGYLKFSGMVFKVVVIGTILFILT